jgi:transposase
MNFHGIDLHTDSLLDATIQSNDIQTVKNEKYYLKGGSFKKLKDSLSKDDYALIEPCTNAFWLYDQIKDSVKECYILNTIKYRRSANKTDKLDAKKLAKKLAYYVMANGDDDDLPRVYIPDIEVRKLRGLFSTYKLNKKIINQLKNRIHSILKENGIYIKRKELFLKRFTSSFNSLPLDEEWKIQIEILKKQLEFTEEQNDELKEIIIKKGYSLFKKEVELLISIKGFSPLTAAALMSDVVDINRFTNVKRFCCYLRCTPMVKGSNDNNKILRTNKQARSLTLSLLSQSLNHFIDSGNHLNSFYERVKVGKKAGVARMALMRKILVSVYHMLKKGQKFYWVNEDLYSRKLKELRAA